ncbi:hypothetical protein OUZ56_013201 [Daphnia magna]|uniref:Uncharacterized protein n=1 Tax=Daphnia magna TaxID=35525 RepID=A0ABQ9Z568_9CRUS|nr:hypothetical protein OUZ56_013201 [Daphnia magna]
MVIFTSPSSSCSSSPHPLQAVRLRLTLFKLFVFASPSSSCSSSPHPLQAVCLRLSLFKLNVFASRFSPGLLHLIAVVVELHGPAALFCPMVDQPWGGAVALSATSTTSESATISKLTTAPTTSGHVSPGTAKTVLKVLTLTLTQLEAGTLGAG